MNEIIIRGIELPVAIKGVTVLDANGDYNVYINILQSLDTQRRATDHEIRHIKKEHFHNFDPVIKNELEANAG